jgi:hypothetical protein
MGKPSTATGDRTGGRVNEFEEDDAWSRKITERLLKPVLRAHAFEGQLHFVGAKSDWALMLQKRAHIDAIGPLAGGADLSLEFKLRRWPGAKHGNPFYRHWLDAFLETWSCSVPPYEQRGWMYTCQADFLIYGLVSLQEDLVDCYPFYMKHLREWFVRNEMGLEEQRVQNRINGRDLWSIGKLAALNRLCNELRVDRFTIREGRLVTDFWGTPILQFMRGVQEYLKERGD